MIDPEQDLDEWAAIEAAHDNRVQTMATVMLALRFSEDARRKALRAEERLMNAAKAAELARDYLARSTVTLEQAVRLHAMGKE